LLYDKYSNNYYYHREDKYGYFQSEVARELIPDYYAKIKAPMSFKTVQQKLDDNQYDQDQELFWVRQLL
jgi:hypothetical protein